MTSKALLFHSLAAVCVLMGTAFAQTPKHAFAIDGERFLLDGKPLQIRSGELHYPRVPREYWHDRMQRMRALGLNTLTTYVFWDLHEPRPGVFDFTGNLDLGAFLKAAQEEGLFVNPVVSPAVAPGQELIRISLMATHTDKQVDFALDKLGKVGKEFGLI